MSLIGQPPPRKKEKESVIPPTPIDGVLSPLDVILPTPGAASPLVSPDVVKPVPQSGIAAPKPQKQKTLNALPTEENDLVINISDDESGGSSNSSETIITTGGLSV